MAFRLYYKGDTLDPDVPVSQLCPDMTIPRERPVKKEMAFHPSTSKDPTTIRAAVGMTAPSQATAGSPEDDDAGLDVAAILGDNKPIEDRRHLLREVREHLDLLKEFEGVISEDDIARRKRELFMALPPAPPPANKKAKTTGTPV